MRKLITIILSFFAEWWLNRKAKKSIKVREYEKKQKWEATHQQLLQRYRDLVEACKQASAKNVEAAKRHDIDSMARWAKRRDELHEKRDLCFAELIQHNGHKP